jgi:hypothetical protein
MYQHHTNVHILLTCNCSPSSRGSQRDVVYLGLPIRPRTRAEMRGEGGAAGSQPMSTAVHMEAK